MTENEERLITVLGQILEFTYKANSRDNLSAWKYLGRIAGLVEYELERIERTLRDGKNNQP